MQLSRLMCLCVLALPVALPVASQSNLSPNAAFGASDREASPGTAANASESRSLEPSIEQLGDQFMQQHRYQEAVEAYRRVPVPSAKLWNHMGMAYQLLLDFNNAVRCYKESARLDPHSALFYNNLATAYDQLGDHRQAEQLYREAIRLAPHSALYFKNLGTNLLAQHEFEKGSEAYMQALSIDPQILDFRNTNTTSMVIPLKDHAETNYVRARSCAQAGLIDCTVVYLRKSLDEGSATPKKIASDSRFQAVLNTPEVQLLLTEQH